MEQYIKSAGFDKIEVEYFTNAYARLDKEDKKLIDNLGREFVYGDTIEIYNSVYESLKTLSEKYNTDIKSIYMVFLLANLDKMKQVYKEKGIDEALFFDMVKDLKYKLDECKKVYGIYGARSFYWYYKIFGGEIVSLGRFQYQKDKFYGENYTWGDITLTSDDDVVRFHIPSSGAMTREMRLDSYKRAFEYYGKKKGEYLVITCVSWLLYPENRSIYPAGSNLLDFMDDFDITDSAEHENPFPNAWRVFGMDFNGDTSILPDKTTLQKNYIEWLKLGNKVGTGMGVIIFDGEKIVNKKEV